MAARAPEVTVADGAGLGGPKPFGPGLSSFGSLKTGCLENAHSSPVLGSGALGLGLRRLLLPSS